MARLSGKVVWITGSAKRVGKAIALECAREGANIIVHCRESAADARVTAAEIGALGREALIVQGDHSHRDDVERIVGEIAARFGRLDALVNSASTFPRVPFEQTTDEILEDALASNLRGPFLCAQLALPWLCRAAPGRIVNILDAAIERPYPNASAYWCAKGGLDALTRALAIELAPAVLVNSVSPGSVLPPEDRAARTGPRSSATPEDVARAVVNLLAALDATGTNVMVDCVD